MKKTLIAAAALTALAGTAHAANNVTLYGVLDQGFGYDSNGFNDGLPTGKAKFAMKGGEMSGNRWGLLGEEDLGNGLKAIFRLESGFDLGTGAAGQGGRLFGRQAYVGLAGANWGSVTLGRQYDSLIDFAAPFAMGSQWAGGIGAHPLDLDNFNNTLRTNNTFKFTSANYNGFSFGGTVSPGGVAGKVGKNLIWSLGAGYQNGPLALGVAGYVNSMSPEFSLSDRVPAVAAGAVLQAARNGLVTKGAKNDAMSDIKATSTAKNDADNAYRVIGVGGSYTFGPAVVSATYSNVRYQAADAIKVTGNLAEVNLKYNVSPAGTFGIGYGYNQLSLGLSGDLSRGLRLGQDPKSLKGTIHQLNLGYDYALSKRTDVYVLGGVQYSKDLQAVLGGTKTSTSARVGLRHKF